MLVDRSEFREGLLVVMEQKSHWAWPAFTGGLVSRELLHVHLEQEFATYVRDFPILVARAYIACPIAEVRRELIANVYEEETGALSAGRPHPELFLEYPRGLGMDVSRFSRIALLPRAAEFRWLVDELTLAKGWETAAAVTTLFLEGTAHERRELDGDRPHSPPPLEEHPLVKHYGLSIEHLALTRAHRAVEGDHRRAAWRVVLDFVDAPRRRSVVAALESVLVAWHAYRDEVARHCGIERDASGAPRRAVTAAP